MAKIQRTPHLLILSGIGGVGKTTLSASLGLSGALQGKQTMTVTIDPARRLADTLGFQISGDKPQVIPMASLTSTPNNNGSFKAVMLNLDTVAEELVRRYAKSTDEADRIITNPIFRIAMKQMAGAEEFLALGKLYQLLSDEPLDLLVVDTAPSTHAHDFFQGPDQLLKILDPKTMKRIKSPIKRFAVSRKISGSGA
ncbi:hypothetical protein K8T06_17555, partial [bacterium]|nr:hypothetical protein [bacterium]